ncbi:HtaA domain-containing protein [Corynebacterium hindlerae]|uniref:HtaA domain-containing protein n=1 Tax=Corynebacterium hindlerae TaxID=699041 RepID=UPI001AD75A22|nr:HtaA domain-containing protein [Corynebacterium hindlerae]QTH59507.1 HtaA domain-containing protein [Corynebacterium hindlerae]
MRARTVTSFCATALIALLGVVPAGHAAEAGTGSCDNPTFEVSGGELSWGFKHSFRRYIDSPVAHGGFETTGDAQLQGAFTDENAAFVFPVNSSSGSASNLEVSSRGGVRFTGHDGVLDSAFSDLKLRFSSDNQAKLIASYNGKLAEDFRPGTPTRDVSEPALELADVQFSESLSATNTQLTGRVVLTQAGNDIGFNGAYRTEADRTVDPLKINLKGKAVCADGSERAIGGSGTSTSGGSKSSGTKIEKLPDRQPVPEANHTIVQWGDTLTLSASGFAPNSVVAVRKGKDTTDIGTATADANGLVRVDITIAPETPLGTTTFSLVGAGAGGGTHTATTHVRIVRSSGVHNFWEGTNEVVNGLVETQRVATAGGNLFTATTGMLNAAEALGAKFGLKTGNANTDAKSDKASQKSVDKPAAATATVKSGAPAGGTASAAGPAATGAAKANAGAQAGVCSATDGKGISQASLSWGVKESFRSYISGNIAKGSWETNGTTYSGGNFVWNGNAGAVTGNNGVIQYTGAVRFTGHDGVLDLNIADPEVQFDGNSGTLFANVRSSDMDGNSRDFGRVALATLSTQPTGTGDSLNLTATTALTSEGAKAFADFYPAGIELDPITVAAQLSGAANCAASHGTSAGGQATGNSASAASAAVKKSNAKNGGAPDAMAQAKNGRTATSLLDEKQQPNTMLVAAVGNPGIPVALALLLIAAFGFMAFSPRGNKFFRRNNEGAGE